MKIQKFLAHAGIVSRRKAEELIKAKKVRINGQTAKIGQRVDPTKDAVNVGNKRIKKLPEFVYILLHKPKNCVSTTKDPQGRKTVLDLLPNELKKVRIYPVGRLDYDSEGLMLLTNDGDYAYRLTHPKFEVLKTYRITIKGNLSERDQEKLAEGFWLEKNFKTSPAKLELKEKREKESVWEITIHEGKKRQVRRMLEAVYHPVKRLVRIKLGPYELGELKSGGWKKVKKLNLVSPKIELLSPSH